MKIYEPVAISLFTVLVLVASFLVGKSVGYREATEQQSMSAQHSTDVTADNMPDLSLNN